MPRLPKEAITCVEAQAGERPRTAWLREVLAKGDAKLAKIVAPESARAFLAPGGRFGPLFSWEVCRDRRRGSVAPWTAR